MKKVSAILIIFSLLSTLVFAAPISKTIKVLFNTSVIKIGSKTSKIETLTYNNKVYVPLNDIAKLNNLKVAFNTKTNTYELTPITQSTTSSVGYSMQNPAPLGTTLTTVVDEYTTKYTFRVTLLDIKRGQEALDMVKKANIFNPDPKTGKEYLLAKFRFELVKIEGEQRAFMLNEGLFTVYSGTKKAYDLCLAVPPEPSLSNDSMYAGSISEGWSIYEVDINDKAPIWSFNSQGYANKGIWFKLYK